MKGKTRGMIARLTELEGWGIPEHWKGQETFPEGWPHASVQTLINLFTGRYPDPDNADGVEIPDTLGWHITTLIEDWGDHEPPTMEAAEDWNWGGGDPGTGYEHVKEGMARELGEQDHPEDLIQYRIMEREVERTGFIATHSQGWYRAGIELYAAASPEEKERWRS